MLQIKDLKGKLPHFTKTGNIKLGNNMWVWSTMKGSNDEIRYIKAFNGECSGTCGKNCQCCTKSCYVNRSYRYGSVLTGHAINTTWIKENMSKTFEYLDKQLERAKKKPKYLRINQSGELQNAKELKKWIDLATKYPETQMYLYTKNYTAVNTVMNQVYAIPPNFTILLSIWHKNGLACYEHWKDHDCIKAFVYDDGELYIRPTTYCKAYNENGKLDHHVTCDKCKKCFNSLKAHKIIGCKAH